MVKSTKKILKTEVEEMEGKDEKKEPREMLNT